MLRFGAAIRQRRQLLGLSQEGLAGQVGFNRTYVTDIEQGNRNVALTGIARIAAALKFTLPQFWREVEHAAPAVRRTRRGRS